MNERKFWMVYSPEGRAPTVMHSSRESAVSEAMRLASLRSGQRFYVLKAISGWEAPAPTVERITLRKMPDDLPF